MIANHNKDYSVVKTFKAGQLAFFNPASISFGNHILLHSGVNKYAIYIDNRKSPTRRTDRLSNRVQKPHAECVVQGAGRRKPHSKHILHRFLYSSLHSG